MAWQVYFLFCNLDLTVVLALGMVSAAAHDILATAVWMHEEAVLASSQSSADFLRCAPAASINRYGNIVFGMFFTSAQCSFDSILGRGEQRHACFCRLVFTSS